MRFVADCYASRCMWASCGSANDTSNVEICHENRRSFISRDRPQWETDDELIESLAQFADGTLSAAQVKARHRLTNEEWTAMGSNDRLVELVEARKLFRIRSGATKRQRAQIEIIDAPPLLGKIIRSPDSNERHVIDAVKILDPSATDGSSEAATASARFEITINLGGDTTLQQIDRSKRRR